MISTFNGAKMKKIIYLFIMLFCWQIVLAQQDGSYMYPVNINPVGEPNKKNCLSIGLYPFPLVISPIALINSPLELSYERKISSMGSVKADIGFSFYAESFIFSAGYKVEKRSINDRSGVSGKIMLGMALNWNPFTGNHKQSGWYVRNIGSEFLSLQFKTDIKVYGGLNANLLFGAIGFHNTDDGEIHYFPELSLGLEYKIKF